MPTYHVVALVSFDVEAPSEADALESVEKGTGYTPLSATVYPDKRAWENAAKVPFSSRRNWYRRGRRG